MCSDTKSAFPPSRQTVQIECVQRCYKPLVLQRQQGTRLYLRSKDVSAMKNYGLYRPTTDIDRYLGTPQ